MLQQAGGIERGYAGDLVEAFCGGRCVDVWGYFLETIMKGQGGKDQETGVHVESWL